MKGTYIAILMKHASNTVKISDSNYKTKICIEKCGD